MRNSSTLRAMYTVHHEKTPKELAHEKEVDERIAAGWGDLPPDRIPPNWRELPSPKKLGGPNGRRLRDCKNQIEVNSNE